MLVSKSGECAGANGGPQAAIDKVAPLRKDSVTRAAQGLKRMLIVDSQVHIWGADTTDRPWPAPAHGRPVVHREQPITAQTLLADMKAAGVDRAIVVPPSWEGDRNDLVAQAVADYPDSFRYAARYSLADPTLPQWIGNWRDNP